MKPQPTVAVVTPPEPLLDVDLAKQHLRVDHGDDDALIAAYIAAASAQIDGPDGWLGRAVGVQVLQADFDCLWSSFSKLDLPFPPLTEVMEVSDISGAIPVVLDGSAWAATSTGVQVLAFPASLRQARVKYAAGYTAPPAPIVAAVLMMVGDLYANREASVIEVGKGSVIANPTVAALLAPYRVWSV